MSDIEVCLSKRAKIYNDFANKDTRSKQKNEAKIKLLRECDNLRYNTKKIEIVNMLGLFIIN